MYPGSPLITRARSSCRWKMSCCSTRTSCCSTTKSCYSTRKSCCSTRTSCCWTTSCCSTRKSCCRSRTSYCSTTVVTAPSAMSCCRSSATAEPRSSGAGGRESIGEAVRIVALGFLLSRGGYCRVLGCEGLGGSMHRITRYAESPADQGTELLHELVSPDSKSSSNIRPLLLLTSTETLFES